MPLVIKLEVIQDFSWTEVPRASPLGWEIVELGCSFHHHVTNDGVRKHFEGHPMVGCTNALLDNSIVSFCFRNMLLSTCEVGAKGPPIILWGLECRRKVPIAACFNYFESSTMTKVKNIM